MTRQTMNAERLMKLVDTFSVAMLTTRTPDGPLRARPMALAGIDDDHTIWLVTSEESAKTDELAAHDEVALTMQSKLAFVSLSATAQVRTDPDKLRELWNEPMRVWFPDGPETPEIRLLRLTPTRGEYWDMRGTHAARFAWEALEAWAKGESIDERDLDENAHGAAQFH